MRNMRGALWALGLAGAAYAWRNRDRLRGQLGQSGSMTSPRQIPDFGGNYDQPASPGTFDQQPSQSGNSWEQPRSSQFGGTDL